LMGIQAVNSYYQQKSYDAQSNVGGHMDT